MTLLDLARVLAIIVGIVFGYGVGRLIWVRYHVFLSFWSVIVAIIVVGLVAERIFNALGLLGAWQVGVFPILVGLGVGLTVTSARPPRQAPWWQLWKV